ncbi:hypothetical protein [Roseivivax isoporae]|uniref:hypothetical protein n=1 Tax=Roseivivax isoporae TaxID=591206 RepID=UPI0012ECA74F|nr:hypothetical protein [Roseivivax isoporae]
MIAAIAPILAAEIASPSGVANNSESEDTQLPQIDRLIIFLSLEDHSILPTSLHIRAQLPTEVALLIAK